MRKAYDTFLQSEVSADLAAQTGSSDPYRYECMLCGEGVRLAAVCSTNMVPHFRHRSGNSDIECKYYLGQCDTFSTDEHPRKSKDERAEFYFDSITKMFYLGLRFSENEIFTYEQLSAIFELRTTNQAEAFYSLRINRRNFDPDIQRMIPLEKFSHNYFLSNTLNSIKRKYNVFKNAEKNVPTFFKMQAGDNDYKAKLVRSSVLYTNISYFVAYQSRKGAPVDTPLPKEMNIEKHFMFETMGRKFFGKILTITSKTVEIDSLLLSWEYQLEAAETLMLLWPPSFLSNGTALINVDNVYLFSTFELQAHGNINVHSGEIKRISDCVSKVVVNSKTKIYKKNAELILEKCECTSSAYIVIPVARNVAKTYAVPDDSTYLFNKSGVSHLSKGISVLLTPKSEIRHYIFGYLDGLVVPHEQLAPTGERLIQDILMHYKRFEAFLWDSYESLRLSQAALKYISTCKKTGRINPAVKRFIDEGQI
jgi:hypothetical protein